MRKSYFLAILVIIVSVTYLRHSFSGMDKKLSALQLLSAEEMKERNRDLDKALQSVKKTISNTNGSFMGQKWYINKKNNVIYWDGKPYVPYGFWGGSIDVGIEIGFKEFNPQTTLGSDLFFKIRQGNYTFKKAQKDYKRNIEYIVNKGGTYVLDLGPVVEDPHTGRRRIRSLNEDDFFPYINRYVLDVTRYNGRTRDLEVAMNPFLGNELLKIYDAQAYIYNYDSNSYTDISQKIKSSFQKRKHRKSRARMDVGTGRDDDPREDAFEERDVDPETDGETNLDADPDRDVDPERDADAREDAFAERDVDPERDSDERGDAFEEREDGTGEKGRLTVRLSNVKFPVSNRLELVVLWKLRYASINGTETRVVAGAGGYYPMWNQKIIKNTKKFWREMLPSLQTKNLRAINLFGGESALSRIFLVHPKEIIQNRNMREFSMREYLEKTIYPNYNDDPYTISEFRRWLKKKFKTISKFNNYAGTNYNDFKEVKWILPMRPNNYLEDSNYTKLFGLFDSMVFEKRLDTLQNEFHQDLFGKWYGEYSRMAKKIWGNVPTFTYAADDGIFIVHSNKPEPLVSLDVHISALRHGVDGIGLSMYEGSRVLDNKSEPSFWNDEDLLSKFIEVQRTTGKTKFMWIYEGINSDKDAGGEWSLGPPSKRYLDGWLRILVERGIKGFFIGGIFPDLGFDKSWTVVRNKDWYSSLKEDITRYAVNTTTIGDSSNNAFTVRDENTESLEGDAGTEEVESLARRHKEIRRLLRRFPEARASTSYKEEFGIWVVRFFTEDRKIAQVSISNNKKEILKVMINVD